VKGADTITQAQKSSKTIVLASVGLATVIFVVDLSLPLGVAGGVPYVALVLVSLWSPRRQHTLVAATGATVLTVLGFFFSPLGGVLWKVLFNRFLAVFAVWVTTILVLQRKRAEEETWKLNQVLEQRVQKRTTELRESEARFRGLLEAAPDGIVVVNHEGRIKFVSAQTEKMFGYNREELLGQPVENLLPERFRQQHGGHRAEYFSSPHARPIGSSLDLCGQRKDGSEFPADISLNPLQTEEGLLVISAIRDITERKQAERELARLAAFPELSPHPVLECDPDGQLLYANRAARRLLRIHETSNPDLCLFFPGLSQLVKRCLENNVEIQGKEIQSGGKTFLWSLSPIPETNHVHIHATDITERKRLQLYESILPICCVCGKVRDDTGTERGKGSWHSLQTFVTEHSDTSLSHTFCPPCYHEYRRQQGLPPEEP
jgi:PAS domain S-box-containing protein